MKRPSFLGWYETLRTRHHWSVLQSVRYALWLSRSTQISNQTENLPGSRSEDLGNPRPRRSLTDWFRFRRSTGEHLQRPELRLNHGK